MPKTKRASQKRPPRPDLSATTEPSLVRVPPAPCLAVDGTGDPGGETFTSAVQALYGVAWTIKMALRRGEGVAIGPLEGLWYFGHSSDGPRARSKWRWKLFLRLEPAARARDLTAAVRILEERGRGDGARDVRIETLREGACVQALHVGPYATEPETVGRMEAFAQAKRLACGGPHHEIYLSDPRRTAPEKLRTILRHPVSRSGAARTSRTRTR